MIHRSIDDQTLALAGLFQSVGLVRDVAHEGKADSAAFQTCVRSIFETSPATTAAVYGGVRNLRLGLEQMVKQVGAARTPENVELTNYVVSVLHLERQLAINPAKQQHNNNNKKKTRGQSLHFDITHENIIA